MTLRHRDDGDRGIVLPLVAMVMTALIVFASFAIDLGYQRVVRRDMQALADVVALDLARRIDGVQTRAFYEGDPLWASAITQSRDRNLATVTGENITLAVQLGRTAADGTFTESAPNEVPLAVKVTASADVDFFFQPRTGHVSRSGVAIRQLNANASAFGNFVLGSFLASADPDFDIDLLDRLLPRFIGSPLDRLSDRVLPDGTRVDAVSYQGLADGTIEAGQLAAELGVGSPDELFTGGARNSRDVYLATARVLEAQGDTAAAEVFRVMAAEVDSSSTVDLGDTFVQQGGPTGAVATGTNQTIDTLFLLNHTAFLINGTNTVSVPSLSFGVPGVTSTTMTLAVTERPVYCIDIPNVHVAPCEARTAQVSVGLTNTVDVAVGIPGVTGARLTGTLTAQAAAAGATGTMTTIRCPGVDPNPGIDITVSANPVTTTTSENLLIRGRLLGPLVVDVATVTIGSTVTSGNQGGGSTTFDYPSEFLPDVGPGQTQRLGSPTLGLGVALAANATNVTLLNIPLGLAAGTVASATNTALAPSLAAIDQLIVRRIARLLGVDIGGADVGAVDLRCFQGTSLVGEPPQVN